MLPLTFLFHQQMGLARIGQGGARSLTASAKLETPHVTDHCGGIECLLQTQKNTKNMEKNTQF